MAVASPLAPTGRLRVGVWLLPFFARDDAGVLRGIVPDLANELARRLGAEPELVPFANPARMIDAFRLGLLDVTFLGITADRAETVAFGPVVIALQTSYLVPAASVIANIAQIDRPGLRIAVPANSAQEAHLQRTLAHATLIPVPAEQPTAALDLLAAGAADAFSHVVPMLAEAQRALPGARVLPGSYFDVPVAIGVAKGRAPAAAAYAVELVEEVKASGFVQRAIDRAGITGVVVSQSSHNS